MANVKISGLHKHYGAVHAVRGIDLDIPDGEFTVLVGPSGCGKSTLLRTIAGLEDADEGDIEIGGEVVNDMRPRDRDVAMVFQDYALYPHMTVFGNIAFGLRARKHAEARDRGRGSSACRRCWASAALLERYPAPALRRPAPARRDRPRHRAQSRASSCSTSRCPISTRSCATRCAARSSGCIRRSRRP